MSSIESDMDYYIRIAMAEEAEQEGKDYDEDLLESRNVTSTQKLNVQTSELKGSTGNEGKIIFSDGFQEVDIVEEAKGKFRRPEKVGYSPEVDEVAGALFVKFGTYTTGNRQFKKLLSTMYARSKNLKRVFNALVTDFYKTNEKDIFSQKGGDSPFKDLNPNYAQYIKPFKRFSKSVRIKQGKSIVVSGKERLYDPYPILVRTGLLKGSLVNRNHPLALHKVGRNSVTLGTMVDYAILHAEGKPTTFKGKNSEREVGLPIRNPVNINMKLPRWLKKVNKFVMGQ